MPEASRHHRAEVVVVGGGLSGLVAARRLMEGGVRSVLVMEARDRVGGRTLNRELPDGAVVDLGGQWAAAKHTRLLALAHELGVDTFPTWNEGLSVLWTRGRRHLYHGDPPLLADPAGLLDFAQSSARLERMSRRLPHGSPWLARRADRLDAITFEAWLRRSTFTPTARSLWALVGATALGGSPRDVSLLFVLHHLRGAGGLSALMDVAGGAQELRFRGGSQTLSTRLAESLGERVWLGAPVERVGASGSGVTVEGPGGRCDARFAIVAMSPADADRIAFTPALPPGRARLQRRMTMASGLKLHAVYQWPFWRAGGLNGQVIADSGPVPLIFDNSPPDDGAGVLMGFAGAFPEGRLGLSDSQLADPDERRRAVLDCLARYFGEPARNPVDYFEQDWGAEPFTEGCIPSMPPGALIETREALREPRGSIHWAGAESAKAWDGYMEGAVAAGERTATEILRAA